jgi:hypothetical protein
MRKFSAALLAFLLFLLCACSIESMLDDDVNRACREYTEAFIARDRVKLRSEASPKLRDMLTDQLIDKIAGQFPQEKPFSISVVRFETKKTLNGPRHDSVEYLYKYWTHGWVRVSITGEKTDSGFIIEGFHTKTVPLETERQSRFAFGNKSLLHYLFLAVAVTIPIFIVITIVACVRTKLKRLKWLWILFIAVGFFSISLNWATGVMSVQPLSVLLLGASAMKLPPLSQLIISIAVPFGAISFWIFRNRIRCDADPVQKTDGDTSRG